MKKYYFISALFILTLIIIGYTTDIKAQTKSPVATTRFYESNIDYHNIVPKINYKGNQSVSVIVQDKRPYILSGEKGPEYVGFFRGGFGRPYDLGTETLKPLSEELSYCITSGFNAAGFTAGNAKKIIAIDIIEWITVSGGGLLSFSAGTEFDYALVIKILDEKNNILVQKEIKGAEDLKCSLSQINKAIPEGTEKLLSSFLNADDIRIELSK